MMASFFASLLALFFSYRPAKAAPPRPAAAMGTPVRTRDLLRSRDLPRPLLLPRLFERYLCQMPAAAAEARPACAMLRLRWSGSRCLFSSSTIESSYM